MVKPLADLLRPETLDDMVGQSHLLDKGSTFRNVIENNHVPNMIFYGPPGVGKTTVAKIIANNANMTLHQLNGTTASLENIKQVIADIKSIFNKNENSSK